LSAPAVDNINLPSNRPNPFGSDTTLIA
jgi:hypothetical protein